MPAAVAREMGGTWGGALDREGLLGIAHAERQRLGRTVQYAEPETWEQPSACPGWWNRDVLAHLGAQDTAAAQLLAGEPAVEIDEYRASIGIEPLDVDGLNTFLVNHRAGLGYREVLGLWGRAADALLALAAKLSDEEWNERRIPWLSGEIAPRYLIQSRIVEWWVHGEDVRATNGLGPQIQHWPVFLTADLGIRMLPWALARAGLSFSELSVHVDLEGAGEGTWHWGLGAGEAPPADKEPDAYICGRAPQFALVAARRLSPDDVLDSGNVVLGGDEGVARTVLEHIRCYV